MKQRQDVTKSFDARHPKPFIPELPLARSALNRNHLRRSEPELFEKLASSSTTRFIPIWSGKTLANVGKPSLRYVASSTFNSPDVWFYLGQSDEHAESGNGIEYVAVVVDEATASSIAPESEWLGLRELGANLNALEAGLLVESVALSNWRASHKFSPRTGNRLESSQAGWVLIDPEDGSEIFPRIDPAIIVTVTDESDRILLGSNAMWASNRYSLLAGFVEPGESLEAAVIREIEEESGIRVQNPQYLGSQSWPYPVSLMLGFSALAAPDQDLNPRPDGTEILDLKWFTREELRSNSDVVLPGKTSIARAMIEAWLTQS
ncbi:MAG: NAD(+) diphosphatase [Cryobacterium sp.]|nr:NAD(+) diphosphatase [Cryobacterium sp.]